MAPDPSLDPSLDPSERESAPPALSPTPRDLVACWNEHRDPGPKVMDLTTSRTRVYTAALAASPLLGEWARAVRWLNAQSYANAPGQGACPTWRATLDWLAQPGRLMTVLEQVSADDLAPRGRGRRRQDLGAPPWIDVPIAATARQREHRRTLQAAEDEAAELVLQLGDPARRRLEALVLGDLEDYRARLSPATFDDLVLRSLPHKLLELSRHRSLPAAVAELEREAVAS